MPRAVACLPKALEYVRQEFGRDSFTVVFDDEQPLRTLRRHADGDMTPLWAELERIGNEVPDGLREALTVPEHLDGFGYAKLEDDALCLSGDSQALHGHA